MVPSCQRAMLALWTLASFYPYLTQCLTLTVATKQLFPGGSIQIESTTNSTDPAVANLYIYDTRHEIQTDLWEAWPAKDSPHSIFTIPSSVIPGPSFVVRATTTSGTFLANSPEFLIVAAGSASSASGSTSSTQTSSMSSFMSTSASTASTTATSSSSSTSGAPSSSASAAPAKSMPLGAIIGGVLGGLALIAVILALILLLRRRRPAKPTAFPVDKAPPPDVFPPQENTRRNPMISPFTLTSPPVLNQIPMDVKHPVQPTTPLTPLRSEKKGLYSPIPPAPGSAGTSSAFASSSENLTKKKMMMEHSDCTDTPDVRRELEELKSQVEILRLQNQAAGINPEAPPVYR